MTILVALLIFTGINVVKAKRYKAEVNKLQTEIIRLNDLEPETITVTETRVEMKYKDRTITKEIVPEGFVKFNLAKYRSAITRTDSLSRQIKLIKAKVSGMKIESGDDERKRDNLLGVISTLKEKVDNLKEVTSVIIDDTGKDDIVYVKTRGICLRPMIGGGYSDAEPPYGGADSITPYFGVKLFYWDKYGLSAGATPKQCGVALSRRMSDLIPLVRNTEILMLIGSPYKKEYSRFFIGLAVSL